MEQFFNQLEEVTGQPVMRIQIDAADFQSFKDGYKDDRKGVNNQKLLEYYISWKYLAFKAEDIYIDIAAQNCPFAFFVHEKFGCEVYRQDLYYMKQEINKSDIGGDACKLPLKDETVSKISLHNSFEHFEGDSDILFIQEAQRVLKVGGKLLIVPLFFEDHYRVENESGWVDEGEKKTSLGEGRPF